MYHTVPYRYGTGMMRIVASMQYFNNFDTKIWLFKREDFKVLKHQY
jgi:hypothetical protein